MPKRKPVSRAVRYYRNYTTEQLVEMSKQICDNPRHQRSVGIWKYSSYAMKRMDDIARAISWQMADRGKVEA